MSSSDTPSTAAKPPPPKKFLNDPHNAVSEMIQGLLLQFPNKLRKLRNHNVLLSSSITHDRVNILSGGGSGHEPSHAGWIGTGMLTGAVLGGIFASPSVASILAAVRAVTEVGSGMGCLLVVKNYTGDRLNFGMACELANAEGRKCRMVVVHDDCALERAKGITGARGVAGTVFVHKVAGAAAARGMDLDVVTEAAEAAAGKIGSLGVALDAVTIPGAAATNDRLDGETIEIGLGIHGEAGIRQAPLQTSDELAKEMVTTIRDYGRKEGVKIVPAFEKGDEVAVMINNLGGTSNFEMSILANSVVSLLEGLDMGCRVSRVYVGSFMTSFDMQGASVSILNLSGDGTDGTKDLLDDPTDAIAWHAADLWKDGDAKRPSAEEVPEVGSPGGGTAALSYESVQNGIDNFSNASATVLRAACTALAESEPLLTKYDTIVGDGDCGLTMERGAKEVLSRIEAGTFDMSHPVPLFVSLADAVSASMGGTSGVLLELMFRKMSTYLLSRESVDETALAAAFGEGVGAVSFYGGASVGSRTMLDALVPAAAALMGEGGTASAAAAAAREGADGTAEMGSASAGRSNYLSEEALQGTPDPGAVAAALVLEAIAKAL